MTTSPRPPKDWAATYIAAASQHDKLLASGALSVKDRSRHLAAMHFALDAAREFSYEQAAPVRKRCREREEAGEYDAVTVAADAHNILLKLLKAHFAQARDTTLRQRLMTGLKPALAAVITPGRAEPKRITRALERYAADSGAPVDCFLVEGLHGLVHRWADTHP